MRIAPKPKPGQEVSLERLLGQTPAENDPMTASPMSMERFDTGWVFSPVKTLNGPMKIWLSSCVEQDRMRSEIQANDSGQRLITADEFYGVLEWIYDFHTLNRPYEGAPVELKAWIANLWERIPPVPFLVNTTARYLTSRKLEVRYRPGGADPIKIRSDLRDSESLFDQTHFGAQDIQRFKKVWEYTSARPVEIRQPESPNQVLGAELNVYLFPGYISVIKERLKGMAFLVKATPVTP